MSFKNIMLIIILLIVVVAWFFYVKRPVRSVEEEVLVIGTVGGYAPFVSVNEQGQYEGFDIDVAKALTQQMGKEFVLKDLGSMTTLLLALEQGSIDAALWALSITEDRLKKVTMVRYQGEETTTYPMLFWQQIPEGISGIYDMRGKTVCVEPNSSQDAVLRKYAGITIKPTERVDDALLMLQYGKTDAVFVEPAIAKKFKKIYPQIQIMDVALAPEDQVYGMGIAIKKGAKELIGCIEEAIKQLTTNGTIAEFEQKWGIS